jgi:16S rRNA (uracil1498-N3)-methyltransferase
MMVSLMKKHHSNQTDPDSMELPFFYIKDILPGTRSVVLDEATAKHIVQVLRMQNGEQLQLTNGKGGLFTAKITENNKRNCVVEILTNNQQPTTSNNISIAISLLKNANRFEWFLEKATELGVNEIIPLICDRTERTHFRHDRMNSILISAMLQSQQSWLPVLQEPVQFRVFTMKHANGHKFIAHCEEESKQSLMGSIDLPGNKLILIGPEGDFSKDEISSAITNNFIPVTLGNTRLRTETAGVIAAALLCAGR